MLVTKQPPPRHHQGLPVEADQSLGPRRIRWGLCTVSLQGEVGIRWGASRRRAGEEKGLSRSEVKGAVISLETDFLSLPAECSLALPLIATVSWWATSL